jgi:hypothetical protein
MFAAISLTSSQNYAEPITARRSTTAGAPSIAHSAMGVILKHSTSHNAVVCSFSHPIHKKNVVLNRCQIQTSKLLT